MLIVIFIHRLPSSSFSKISQPFPKVTKMKNSPANTSASNSTETAVLATQIENRLSQRTKEIYRRLPMQYSSFLFKKAFTSIIHSFYLRSPFLYPLNLIEFCNTIFRFQHLKVYGPHIKVNRQ